MSKNFSKKNIKFLKQNSPKRISSNDFSSLDYIDRQYLLKNLAAIVESSDDAIIGMTLDGIITSWNNGAEKIYGYSVKEILGHPITLLVPLNRHGELRQILKKIQNGKRVEHFETIHLRKDDRKLYVSLTISPIKGENGAIIGASTISRDITKHKKMEDALQRSERELWVLNSITRLFLTVIDEEIYYAVLKILLNAFESEYGLFGYIDENNTFIIPSMTFNMWNKCRIPNKTFAFPHNVLDNSICLHVIRQKKMLYSNTSLKKSPEGHLPILRTICAPIIHHDNVIGLLQVANKKTDYTDDDVHLMEVIVKYIAPILNARLQRERAEKARKIAEEELRKYHMHLETLIQQRTAELRDSEMKYRLITENANDLIVVIDPGLNIEYINEKMSLKITGYSLNDLQTLNSDKLIHSEDQTKFRELVNETFAKGEGTGEIRIKDKLGKYVWFEVHCRIFKDQKNQTKIIVIARDISERKATEEIKAKLTEAIQRQNIELKELGILKDAFLADISHEFLTPLIAIKGFTELLLNAPNLDANQRKDLQAILRNELRLENLVHELLNFSGLRSGKVFLKKESFKIRDILKDLKNELKDMIQQKQVTIEEIIEPKMNIILDKIQIKKLLRNLLTNAIKFSFKGGKILIKSIINNGTWLFSIQDQGIGIQESDLSKLFSLFTRLKNRTEIDVTGLGLGLASCRKIVDAYGGTIWAESSGLNKGTTFYFQIPLTSQ